MLHYVVYLEERGLKCRQLLRVNSQPNMKIKTTFLVLIGIYFRLISAKDNVFISNELVKRAFQIDRQIAQLLTNVTTKFYEEKVLVNKYLIEHRKLKADFKWNADVLSENEIEEVIENPILAFQIARRLSIDYDALPKKYRKTFPKEINETASQLMGLEVDIGRSIVRFQRSHHLPAKELANGRILHLQTKARLTVGDCLTLGKLAQELEALDLFVDWCEEGHRQCEETTKKLSDEKKQEKICEKSTQIVYNKAVELHKEWLDKGGNPNEEQSLCNKVSSHHYFNTNSHQNELYCMYLEVSPLQRYGLEMHSGDPLIITLWEVVTPSQAQALVNQAKIKLNAENQKIQTQRWESVKLLENTEIAETISKKMQYITKIKVNGYQVTNFGYSTLDEKEESRERADEEREKSTMMIHLSKVELGGGIIFPSLGLGFQLHQGCATLWDRQIRHYHCPVIMGNKWIATDIRVPSSCH